MSRAPAELGARAGDNPVDHTVEPTFSPVDKFRVIPRGADTPCKPVGRCGSSPDSKMPSEQRKHTTFHNPQALLLLLPSINS